MNRIKVEVVHLPPEKVLIEAIKKPYKTEKADMELVKKVGKIHKHLSTWEHCNITFNITGISRLCLQEVARHRIASYTVESTRFTLKNVLSSDELVIKDFCVEPPNQTLASIKSNTLAMQAILEELNRGVPNDTVKYMLPESYRVNLTMTINLRSLVNFLELREAPGAHFEIRHLAGLIREELKGTYVEELL